MAAMNIRVYMLSTQPAITSEVWKWAMMEGKATETMVASSVDMKTGIAAATKTRYLRVDIPPGNKRRGQIDIQGMAVPKEVRSFFRDQLHLYDIRGSLSGDVTGDEEPGKSTYRLSLKITIPPAFVSCI